jgi:hypothetical protein
MEVILNELLFMKDVYICKYTPATLNKELLSRIALIFFLRNPYQSSNPRFYMIVDFLNSIFSFLPNSGTLPFT